MLAAAGAGRALAEESAQEISRKSRERGALNLLDLTAELRLVTTGKDGAVKEQRLVSSARKVGGKLHSLARFTEPSGVAGVAVLTVQGEGAAADEISLYLPKLKRVRKIVQSQRGESFMQTDFSYADLGSSGGARDEALKREPDAAAEGRQCYVLRGSPGEGSPYGEVTLFVDQETYVPMRVEYRDRDGKLLKVFRALKLKRFQDRTLAAEAVMENAAQGSRTALTVLRLEASRLSDDDFTERALERG
ncbi:MAG TPA: outer membrane lipoprotein-sorting protein [Myxococcales bacterium]|nr:outer membrane lipoprotein-sorting protein [Myxococcales bacterium]